MAREIVTSENREEFINKKLGINPKEINHPLSKKDFHKHYVAQHKDIKNKDLESKEKAKKEILKTGFHKGFNVNALPISMGGEPKNIIDKAYGNKKGDTVYLLPKKGVIEGRNGYATKEGHIPTEHEIVDIGNDNESTYDAYLKKYKK
jgi:hypothetical protein